jgi:hypothetical protein
LEAAASRDESRDASSREDVREITELLSSPFWS